MKTLTRRGFLRLLGIAGAGVVASQIPIKKTLPSPPPTKMAGAGKAVADRPAKVIKFGDNFPPHQVLYGRDDYNNIVIGPNAGQDCDYTVLIGTTSEQYSPCEVYARYAESIGMSALTTEQRVDALIEAISKQSPRLF